MNRLHLIEAVMGTLHSTTIFILWSRQTVAAGLYCRKTITAFFGKLWAIETCWYLNNKNTLLKVCNKYFCLHWRENEGKMEGRKSHKKKIDKHSLRLVFISVCLNIWTLSWAVDHRKHQTHSFPNKRKINT